MRDVGYMCQIPSPEGRERRAGPDGEERASKEGANLGWDEMTKKMAEGPTRPKIYWCRWGVGRAEFVLLSI